VSAVSPWTTATLPNGTKITYVVDAENHRVGKEVSGVLQAGFLYDGNQLVAQLNGSNQVVSQFVYASGATSPDYMVSGGVTYRIFSDQLGSPRLVVNTSTGAITEQINYDEFGNVISDTNPGFQPFGFAGGLYDQDTKLLRFGARDYNSTIGRWTAKDPIRFKGGDTNLYGYVLNDPVNLVDSLGLDSVDPVIIDSMMRKRLKKPAEPVCDCDYEYTVLEQLFREISYWHQEIERLYPPGATLDEGFNQIAGEIGRLRKIRTQYQQPDCIHGSSRKGYIVVPETFASSGAATRD